ncbi:LL-diaminopimelate aminotransferase [Spirochaeta thermophila]|uniref:LL-diaminopimelate aminotransferase n=1 Tax=Winmispira thermophila (strain ATCC 49972 / DSM 6192 / RI 19.B1) TaxID=665571 RepID=E0RP36_WINT6|nr:LL-diaminopimelate aminotransferase [Spirochaeta thermophila]ADN02698.1 putative aminotransferase [Spirochaeta thermophila DSM 6192]
MARMNEHFLKLTSSYLFSEIAKRVNTYKEAHPEADIIKMGIGDVTLPLPEACIRAFHEAVDEMARAESFKGYGPEQGYAFLREAIAEGDYRSRGVEIDPEEIFISDGAKSDTANFQDLFSSDAKIAIQDPVYPVYLDTNVMAGRTGSHRDGRYEGVIYLPCVPENRFLPEPPDEEVDVVYLCYPNNPTGAVAPRDYLALWVEYARRHDAIILFDGAYEAFIQDPDLPRSIYEIPGAREVAVEFRSFSKTAGFTGTRCAYTVVPKECRVKDSEGRFHSLHDLWFRRQSTKFNGVSYPVQRAAAAVYTPEGQAQVRANIAYYMENARIFREALTGLGYACTGGEDSPYIWVETGTDSWEFFQLLLERAQVVCTPGAGFGKSGEGFVRFSAFNFRENVEEAARRLSTVFSGATQ